MDTNKKIFIVIALFVLVFATSAVNAVGDNDTSSAGDMPTKEISCDYSNSNTYTNTDVTNNIQTKDNDKELKSANSITVSNYNQLHDALVENSNNSCIINLKKGTYKINQSFTPYLYNKSDITINGNQSTIIGYNIDPYEFNPTLNDDFIYTEGKLTINNLTIKNCDEIFEGFDYSTIILNNCNFTDNHATFNGILSSSGNVKIYNCNFINNCGANTAIMEVNGYKEDTSTTEESYILTGIVEIKNSTFKNNYVYSWDYELSDGPGELCFMMMDLSTNITNIINCTFDENYAVFLNEDEIGLCGIYIDSKYVIINNSKFLNMQNILYYEDYDDIDEYSYDTGLIDITNPDNGSYVYITNNIFKNIEYYSAINTKGVILNCYGSPMDTKARLNLYNNTFTNISITSLDESLSNVEGGLIYSSNMYTLMNNNTFQVNITNSTVFGGVVFFDCDMTKNNVFIDNTVTTNINKYEVYGGAIYNTELSNLTTDNYSNRGIIKAGTIENKTTFNDGNITIITKDEAVLKINAPKNADTGSIITINITASDKNINKNRFVGKTGKVAVKINGITVKDVKTNSSIIELYDGKGSINVSLAGLSGLKNYTISAVLSKAEYTRTENSTKILINKQTYKAFTLNINASSEQQIRIKQTLKDTNGNIIHGISKVAVKLGDRTVKTLSVINGNLDTTVTVPFLPQGNNKFIITLGENYRYDSLRINQTINIHKQNVTATIKSVKAKAGEKISVEAKLINKDTKTNVLSGKYIFKVNGVTIPAIINDKEVFTTQNVANGIAKGTYTLPKDIKKGSYDITIAYQGNTQSNALKYAQKSLTII